MLLVVLATIVLRVATTSSAEGVQVPMLTMCPESQNVQVTNLNATSEPGSNMLNLSFHMDVATSLQKNVTLTVAIMAEGMTSMIPCIEDVGSCEYMLCGGNTTMEMEITKSWNNTCPIPAKVYHVNMTLDLTKNPHLTSGSAIKVFNYTFEDSGKVVGCASFEVNVPPGPGSAASYHAAFHMSWILVFSLLILKCW